MRFIVPYKIRANIYLNLFAVGVLEGPFFIEWDRCPYLLSRTLFAADPGFPFGKAGA